MNGIRRALVLGLVLIAGTAIEQAPSVGPIVFDILLLVASLKKDSYCSKVIDPSNVLYFAFH